MTLTMDLQAKYGRDKYYRAWVDKVPPIRFPRTWDICILPPFAGALCRFQVNGHVSVFLDGDNSLGHWLDEDRNPAAYWEIYPLDGDIMRYDLNDTRGLLAGIKKSLRQGTK